MIGFDGTLLWNTSLGTGFPGAAPSAMNGSIYMVTDEANSRLIAMSNLGEIYWQKALSPCQLFSERTDLQRWSALHILR